MRKWAPLLAVCMGTFMLVVDETITLVALPDISTSLHASLDALAWVVDGYALALAAALLAVGTLADRWGQRRVYLAGLAVFTLSSLVCGLSATPALLITMRVVQGAGAAGIYATSISLLRNTYSGRERATALGVWGAVASGGAALGPLAGGILTQAFGWGWIFFVNVPVGVALAVATVRFVPESRPDLTDRTFDLPGAVSVTVGLVVLVFAVVKSNSYGWGSPETIGLLAAGLLLLAGFLVIERRSPAPLVRLGIFRLRSLAASDLTLLLTAAAVFATFFFVSLYLQQVLGYRSLTAGAAFLPFSAGIATGATVARKLVARLGARVVPVIGLALAAAGMIVLTQVPVHGRYISDVLPGVLPLGIGLGLTFVPITLVGTSEVGIDDAGLASGLLNTAQEVGGAIGLAILSTLAASRTTSLLHGSIAPGSVAAARVSGFHVAFIAAAVLLGVAWTVAVLQLRTRRDGDPKGVVVSRGVAARAIGCAQCAPVAIARPPRLQAGTAADAPTAVRHL